MERIPIQIDSRERFELDIAKLNCYVSLRTSLNSFPGSLHWHIKNNVEKMGTLELTILQTGEAWLSVHSNRHKPWIDEVIEQIT